jgi:3-phosphoshikimate 1-carboxyvinyltransferase
MELEVKKADIIKGVVKAPPSKSYSHRAFIISSLAEGTSRIKYPLYSEDTIATIQSCQALGAKINSNNSEYIIKGTGGRLETPKNVLDVKNSGTTLRILSSVASLAPHYTVITGDRSLRNRPLQELINSLQKLGVNIFSSRNNGMAPIIVEGGFRGGKTFIKGDVSSQFISSILITSPYAKNPVDLEIHGNFISKPYVDITLDVMQHFGVEVESEFSSSSPSKNDFSFTFHIEPQTYNGTEYTVEGDYSSASYLIAAAAALKSDLTVQNLKTESKQGDKLIVDIVEEMGCDIRLSDNQVKIKGTGELEGIDVNLKNTPDLLPTVAALGAMAQGTTSIKGVEHARYKETDRIQACALELKKLGVSVIEKKDGLLIEGGVTGGVVNSHNDHRMVMALYLIGLKVGDVKIENASVYDVSFPNFIDLMEKLVAGSGK